MTSLPAQRDEVECLTGPRTSKPLAEIAKAVGARPLHSRWIIIDQATIDAFATLTNDHNWLHVDRMRASQSGVGTTIAHGFLTLSLIATMAYDVTPSVADAKMGMNYGFNKIRFISPVAAGSRVRGAFTLVRVTQDPARARAELTYDVVIEIEGKDKPALVAEWIRVAIL